MHILKCVCGRPSICDLRCKVLDAGHIVLSHYWLTHRWRQRKERRLERQPRPGNALFARLGHLAWLWQLVIFCFWLPLLHRPWWCPFPFSNSQDWVSEDWGLQIPLYPLKLALATPPYHRVSGILVGSFRRGNLAGGLCSLAQKPPLRKRGGERLLAGPQWVG